LPAAALGNQTQLPGARRWKDGKPYDEAIYMQSLRRRGSLLAGILGTSTGVEWKSVGSVANFAAGKLVG